MPTKVKISFGQILRQSGETPHDELSIFSEIAYMFKSINYQGVKIDIDWSDILESAKDSHYWTTRLFGAKSKIEADKALEDMQVILENKTIRDVNDLDVVLFARVDDDNAFDAIQKLFGLLSSIFLAANLTSPGALHLWPGRVNIRDQQELNNPYFPKILLLNASSWEASFGLAQSLQWPELPILTFTQVWRWIERLEIPAGRATNQTHNALFALLNSSKDTWPIDQSKLLWIVLALEGLYGLSGGGIASSLKRRMFAYLGHPNDNEKKIAKRLNEVYRERSKFVHGQTLNPNPSGIFELDDEYIGKLLGANEFITFCLIATLQRMILLDWKGLSFEEKAFAQ